MGDTGDLFGDLKDIRRTKAQQRVAEFQAKQQDIEAAIIAIGAEEGATVYCRSDQSGTFNVTVYSNRGPLRSRHKGVTIQYYPTKGTWQVKGRMWHGGVDAFKTWVTKTMRKVL